MSRIKLALLLLLIAAAVLIGVVVVDASADKLENRSGDMPTPVEMHDHFGEVAEMMAQPCRCGECEHHDDCICVVCEDGETVVCSLQHGHVDKNGFCNKAKRKGGGH